MNQMTQKEMDGLSALVVHHIDYNKKNCNIDNLITLCSKCHGRTNFNRDHWMARFSEKLERNSHHGDNKSEG